MYVWKTAKFFLSSTFQDLEMERDEVVKLFARMRKIAAKRCISLLLYDLRWREKHVDESVVAWCLDMVRQCQYFVGILGNRYGWRPEENNPREISITEMEIEEALKSSEKKNRFFCFGNLGIEDRDAKEKKALERLKEKIQEAGEEVYFFENQRELLNIMEENLQRRIDRDYPQKVEMEKYDRQKALEEFIAQKRAGFMGRKEFLKRLENFALGGEKENILGISAVAGTGKSALMSKFIEQCKKLGIEIIYHFMSMNRDSRKVEDMISHFAHQLWEKEIIQAPLAFDPIELRRQFRDALEQNEKKLVFLIDGLDEIETSGQDLLWLPRNTKSNTRFLFSYRPVSVCDALRHRRFFQEIILPPLGEDSIAGIIDEYSDSHNLDLDHRDRELLRKRAKGNPLFLRVALEEIQSSGTAIGQMETSISGLFEQILGRLCEKYGDKKILDYLGFLCAGRSGISESELMECLEFQNFHDDFMNVTLSLQNFVVERAGLLDFFHPEFERVVKERLGKGEMRRYHQKLAKYFESKDMIIRVHL